MSPPQPRARAQVPEKRPPSAHRFRSLRPNVAPTTFINISHLNVCRAALAVPTSSTHCRRVQPPVDRRWMTMHTGTSQTTAEPNVTNAAEPNPTAAAQQNVTAAEQSTTTAEQSTTAAEQSTTTAEQNATAAEQSTTAAEQSTTTTGQTTTATGHTTTATGHNMTATEHTTTAAMPNTTAAGENATGFGAAANHDDDGSYQRNLEMMLTVQAYVLSCIVVFMILTPIVLAVYTAVHGLVNKLVLYFHLIFPQVSHMMLYLMYHCHVVFLAIFVLVGLAGLYLAMWRSSNLDIHISISHENGLIAE